MFVKSMHCSNRNEIIYLSGNFHLYFNNTYLIYTYSNNRNNRLCLFYEHADESTRLVVIVIIIFITLEVFLTTIDYMLFSSRVKQRTQRSTKCRNNITVD